MFSRLVASEVAEEVNIQYLSNSLKSRGYTFTRQRYRELESGLSTCSFTVQKFNTLMTTFVMRLGSKNFISAGYCDGNLIHQKEFSHQTELPDIVDHIFLKCGKKGDSNEQGKFQTYLEKLQTVASALEKKSNDYLTFSQEVKITPQYENLIRLEKKTYQKIIADTGVILKNRDALQQKNRSLMDPLLKIEQKKQSLENTIINFEEQRNYLSNIEARLDEHILVKKQATEELDLYTLNEETLDQYIKNLTQLKQLELKKKYLLK